MALINSLTVEETGMKECNSGEISPQLETINCDFFKGVSLEIICKVLECLPLQDVLKMSYQCKKMKEAVYLYLKTLKSINFTEGKLEGWMSSALTDDDLYSLISRCKELRFIYGFHPIFISERRQRGKNKQKLSIPGVLSALNLAPKLQGVEISNIFLLGAILNYFPDLKIIGTFKNRIKLMPYESSRLNLTTNPRVTSLHLTGVVIPELPKMESVVYLYLRMVKITHPDPFKDFVVPNLHTFVMSHCSGPPNTLSYVQLLAALAAAKSMSRLELVRVPFLGGLLQHIVEDSWRSLGFRMLTTVIFGNCKNALELDLGYLLITAAKRLKELSIQPSLTKDSLFSALKMADVTFSNFRSLHLGYVDPLTESGETVMLEDLHDTPESPAMITDNGMKAIGQIFVGINQLEMYNCPHLLQPSTWFTTGVQTWAFLEHLTLRRCHAVRLSDFRNALSNLPRLETLHLEYMFREPPKGCARVGLSAGTGLGVSSALVQNHENGAVQNPVADDGEEDGGAVDDINNNNENHNHNVENIQLPSSRSDLQSRNQANSVPAQNNNTASHTRSRSDKETNNFEEFDMELVNDAEDFNGSETFASSSGQRNQNSNTEEQEAYEFSQPGCSHWNDKDCSPPAPKVRKTVKVSNVKGQNNRYATEFSGNINAPTKSVKIISVKCRSPSPPKSRPSCNGENSVSGSGSLPTGSIPTHSLPNTNQDTVNTYSPSNSTVNQGTSQSTGNSTIHNMCPRNSKDLPIGHSNTNDMSSSTTAPGNPNPNFDYMFNKPPPKYNDCHGNNGNMTENDSSSLPSNIPSPHPHPCYPSRGNVDPPLYDPRNAVSDNMMTMDISPPDYNTAMAEGNVIDIAPCSCVMPHSSNNHQQIPNSNSEGTVVDSIEDDASKPSTGSTSESSITSQNRGHIMYAANDSNLNDHQEKSASCKLTGTENFTSRKGKSLVGKKKGIVKRKSTTSSDVSLTPSLSCDKACQAVSEEIREATLKAQQECEEEKRRTGQQGRKSLSTRRSSRLQGTSLADDVSSTIKPKRISHPSNVRAQYRDNVCHKSTSTSDPVKEDDHIQVLLLRSNSLVNVYLHMVGITDLIVDKCPNLTFITGGACRVLKKVTIYSAPKLSKTSFYQCPKLDQTHLVNEVCDQISERNRTVFLRPMQNFDPRDFESMLFHQPDIGYHLCIVYDYSPCPNQTLYNRIRVSNWMDLFCGMNSDLLRTMDFTETSWYRVDADRYPWKRDIYRMQGVNDNGSVWEIMTDIPWLRMLSQCPNVRDGRQLLDDSKDGVYCPAAKGHYTVEDCMDDLTLDLAEYKASNQIFFCNCIVVFFNMCDTSGRVAPDFYS